MAKRKIRMPGADPHREAQQDGTILMKINSKNFSLRLTR
jgi:hypothetical protein